MLPALPERPLRFSPDALRRPTAQRYFLDDQSFSVAKSPMPDYSPASCSSPVDSSVPSSPPASLDFLPKAADDQFPLTPTTLSSLSLSALHDGHDELGEADDGIVLPSFDPGLSMKNKSLHDQDPEDLRSESSADASSDHVRRAMPAVDDTSLEAEPSRHVDYLSHEWKEEDIWSSWRYVVARRHVYSNGIRLENASWRTWAKSKYRLGTISPEQLNWLKDCDVTWLYGPLKASIKHLRSHESPPPSRLETPSSTGDRKPILKKKTMSETILQRSLTQHTLLKHAGAILQAQEAENPRIRAPFARSTSDFRGIRISSTTLSTRNTTTSSGTMSPNEKRHIHFNNEVVQCIAVDVKDGDEDDDYWPNRIDDDSSSDDGLVMMNQLPSSKGSMTSSRSTSRTSASSESKTIAPLPPTTLKYRSDTPEPSVSQTMAAWSFNRPRSTSSPTPSVETIRPSAPQANFLLDDGEEFDDGLDFHWQPKQCASHSDGDRDGSHPWFVNPKDEEELEMDRRLHLTPSGMLMPYEERESTSNTVLGRVIDTVNTARDIAHVIWNVGWLR